MNLAVNVVGRGRKVRHSVGGEQAVGGNNVVFRGPTGGKKDALRGCGDRHGERTLGKTTLEKKGYNQSKRNGLASSLQIEKEKSLWTRKGVGRVVE